MITGSPSMPLRCVITYSRVQYVYTDTHTDALAVPWNHDAFHFDWQELLPGIKARYYLSCPVRMGLTGVTFSLVWRGVSIHYPVSSERAAGTDCCLSPQRLSVLFYVCHTLTRENESMQPRARCTGLFPAMCTETHDAPADPADMLRCEYSACLFDM